MTSVLRGREKRILALSAILFTLGVLFHVGGMYSRKASALVEESSPPASRISTSVSPPSPLRSYPDPDTYPHFVFTEEEKMITIDVTCTDKNVAVLIYETNSDYRKSPLDAKYNIAHPCDNGGAQLTVDLTGKPFVDGLEYYVIRAQQGDGEWYNPY